MERSIVRTLLLKGDDKLDVRLKALGNDKMRGASLSVNRNQSNFTWGNNPIFRLFDIIWFLFCPC